MHPEADAFLDAIFDNPDDDTPRLVYADWLQEHGHEDYARFLRLSVLGEGGSVPAESRRIRSERKGLWKRIRAVRYDAIVGVPMQDYNRGILKNLTTSSDLLVRTIASWWPAMTPPSLSVSGVRGFGPRSIEAEVVTAVGERLPWLRELRLISSHQSAFVSEFTIDGPLDGSLFAELAKPGVLPRLRSLHVAVTRVDAPALRAFAESDLASRLERLYVEVSLTERAFNEHIAVNEKRAPDAVKHAIEAFLTRYE